MRRAFRLASVWILATSAALPAQPAGRGSDETSQSGRIPAATKAGGYLVALIADSEASTETSKWSALASRAARFHKAKVVTIPARDLAALGAALRRDLPANLLIVVPPRLLDVTVHRRILLQVFDLDTDPFADLAFGYLSARDAAAADALWSRIEALHRNGLSSKTWIETAVTSSGTSFTADGSIPEQAKAAGFRGAEHYFADIEHDPGVLEHARKKLADLSSAGVVSMSGNGDPQGIWLFSGNRNLDRSKHWPFDPAKVGSDPKGEMPRLLARDFRGLKLKSPIVWSGTCHSGATCRVLVEGDIVSTFGRSDAVALYEMPADESLCLALLDAGAGSLLVPIGANHGLAASREQAFAFTWGATLGESVKSTWDDVALQAGGAPKLAIEEPGRPPMDAGEQIMQGGGANRILIGDPALKPFGASAHPGEKIEVRPVTGAKGFDVAVELADGFHAWDWDMYGTDRSRDWRIFVRVALDGLVPKEGASFSASVEVEGPDGKPASHVLTNAVAEEFHGRRFLHLQANAPRANLAYKARKALFRVRLAD